jgi:hypothetical protein
MSGILNTTGSVSGILGKSVLPVGVTGGSGLTALGTVASGNLSNTNIVYPVGHIIKVNAFNDQTQVLIPANHTGAKIVEVDFTAQATNSAYYFGCTIVTTTNDAGSNSDRGDRAVTCWLEDSSAGNKYRFGYRKTSSVMHTTMMAANDYYALADTDSGIMVSSAWNESHYSWSWVAGNQPAEETTTVVNSAFGAGDTITLHVWLGSATFGAAYNKASYSSTANGSRSVFSIIEVAT